jgi:uncharacterized protein (DUF2141 family)
MISLPKFLSSLLLPAACLCLIALLIVSCAQIVPPSGGKKDTTPPRAKKYIPDSAAIHFKSKTVEILFDEFIQLKDLNNQLIISPPMEKLPEVKVKNKTLLLEFREPLKDSTTYTINFGTAIQDIHESTPIDNFRYVFSTGSYIDSLKVSGVVTNAFTHLPEKGVMVMLHNHLEDSVPYKKEPAYFSRTDVNGKYTILNVKPGKYRVFALRDGNSNYRYDAEEMIGFKSDTLDLNHNDTVNISMFKEVNKQRLKRAYQAGFGKIIFCFNKPAEHPEIKALNHSFQKNEELLEYNTAGDSITYWFTNPVVDTLRLQISESGKIYDTVRYRLITKERVLKENKGVKPSLRLKVNANKANLFDLGASLLLDADQPIVSRNKDFYSKCTLLEDTLKKNLFPKGSLRFVNTERNQRLQSWKDTCKVIKENTKYHLLILPGAFTNIFGWTNDTLTTEFKTQELRYYGTMKMRLHLPPGKYIYQLLDEKEGIVHEQRVKNEGEEIYYENLPPAKYHARLIVDENDNGKWDTGNYLKGKQPERVIYDIEPILIRSNWDPDFDWYVKQ